MVSYDNNYNRALRNKLREINESKIVHDDKVHNVPMLSEITSPLEHITQVEKGIEPGQAQLAITVQDLGYEPTNLLQDGELKEKKVRKSRKGAGMSAAGMSAAGMSAGTEPPILLGQKSETGGALLSLKNLDDVKGDPLPDTSLETQPITGGSKKVNRRNELVKQIMKEKGLSLPQASKYIKENKLY